MKLLRDKVLRETYMCNKVCGMISRGELRENHPQQRKAGQWDKETRDNFIVTVIQNEDFDPIKICEQLTNKGIILWLIDGLQRSTTIADFKAGVFKLGKNINPAFVEYQIAEKDENGEMIYKNVEYDLRNKSYAELPDKLKEDFDSCPVMVVKHLACTDEEVGRHIVRYNSGAKMVKGQKLATYLPTRAADVKRLSGHDFFNDCANYKESKDKNGEIETVVCESIIFMNIFDKWNRETRKMGSLIEENITSEMFDKFNNQLDRLLNLITPEMGNLFSTKNALLWFKLFDKFSELGIKDERFVDFLNEFETSLKKVKVQVSKKYKLNKNTEEERETDVLSFHELDSNNSSKDRGVLTDRMTILETLMMNYLHSDIEELEKLHSVEENLSDETTLSFVQNAVNSSINEEDIALYEEMLKDFEVEIPENSVLLDKKFEKPLVALIAYACAKEVDDVFPAWLVEFEKENITYNGIQSSYDVMKGSFDNYVERKVA